MNYADLSAGWGPGLVQGANRYAGQNQKTADFVARYLRSQDPDGKSTTADLIQGTLPGNLQHGVMDGMAKLLGLGAPATGAVGAGAVSDALGAGAGMGIGSMASLY